MAQMARCQKVFGWARSCVFVLVLSIAGNAQAVSIAGYTFADEDFADTILSSSGEGFFKITGGP